MTDLEILLQQIRACTICQNFLPLGPNPVVRAGENARLMLIGQAPGIKVHNSGVPWQDASGKRLRQWLNLSDEDFYDEQKVAIMPMGFCYPGRGKSGDLPPRPECAPQWHQQLLHLLPNIKMTIYIGQYAQNYYLNDAYSTLTERVKHWQDFKAYEFALPHPSPRNQIWLKKNPWFEQQALPELQRRLARIWA